MNRITMAAIAAVLAGGMGLAACTSAPTASAAPAGPVASLRGSDAATTDHARGSPSVAARRANVRASS